MDPTRFAALVRRLELEAAAAPRRYRARVVLLSLLGYAYIGAVVLVLLALVALCLWLLVTRRSGTAALGKIAIALLVLAGVVARAMWVRFDPPAGRPLSRDDAPKLFEEAEALRRRLRAPKPHVVLLSDDYNACIAQIPRLGVFGWPRNYLVVGLPLLATLPVEQVRAVLAHEFAHLSSAHGAFGSWLYRVRATWYQLMTRLDESQSAASALFRRFFDWYAPCFGACSFVLVRRHELDADRLAADVVGRTRMAQALVDLEVRGAFLGERFWPALWREVETRITPPADVYARLAAAARAPLADRDAADWFTIAMRARTDVDDTHPSLRDRVAALVGDPDGARRAADGAALAPTAAFAAPAADHYLGAAHERLAAELGAGWALEGRSAWTERRERLREAREELARLESDAARRALDLEDRWRLASLTEEVHGSAAALPLYQALLRAHPDHLSAAFAVGRLLLDAGDEAGRALVDDVMERDPDAVLAGCRVVHRFLVREGRLDEADRYRARAASRAEAEERAAEERDFLTAADEYAPAELPTAVVASLVAQLDAIDGVHRAWLARKVLRRSAGAEDAPLHVLVVAPSPVYLWPEYRMQGQMDRALAIARRLEVPEGVSVHPIADAGIAPMKPLRRLPGALLYEAKRRRNERRAARTRARAA